MHGGGDGGGGEVEGGEDLGGGVEGVEAVAEAAEAGGRGAGEAEGARDGEGPAAVGLLQRPERLEGEVERLLVYPARLALPTHDSQFQFHHCIILPFPPRLLP